MAEPAELQRSRSSTRQLKRRATRSVIGAVSVEEKSRLRTLLRLQDDERHSLMHEMAKLQNEQQGLGLTLERVRGHANGDNGREAAQRYLRLIERQRRALETAQGQIAQSMSVPGGRTDESKQTSGQVAPHAAMEREVDRWDGRLQVEMKRLASAEHAALALRRAVDAARVERREDDEKLRAAREELAELAREKKCLEQRTWDHEASAAECVAALEALRETATRERDEYDSAEGALREELAPFAEASDAAEPLALGRDGSSAVDRQRRALRLDEAERGKRLEAKRSLQAVHQRNALRQEAAKARVADAQRQAQEYEAGWAAICEACHLESADDVVAHFLELEEAAVAAWASCREAEAGRRDAEARLDDLTSQLASARSEAEEQSASAQRRADATEKRRQADRAAAAQMEARLTSVQRSLDSVARCLGSFLARAHASGSLAALDTPQPLAFFALPPEVSVGGRNSASAASPGARWSTSARRSRSGFVDGSWTALEACLGSFEEVALHLLRCFLRLHAAGLLPPEAEGLVPAADMDSLTPKPSVAHCRPGQRRTEVDSLPSLALELDVADGLVPPGTSAPQPLV